MTTHTARCSFTFGPASGATVWYRPAGLPDQVAIPLGAFADPQFPAPGISVHEARLHGWVTMPDQVEPWA